MKKQLFTSLHSELSQSLDVFGKIPPWINGVFLRNGPGKFEQGNIQMKSWADGYAMLHKFVLSEGNVFYLNRFLKTETFVNDQKTGRLSSYSISEPENHTHSLWDRVRRVLVPAVMDNNNLNVFTFQNRYFANSDFEMMTEINLEDLETIGGFKFHEDYSNRVHLSSAHPCIDQQEGELFNFITDFGPNTYFRVFKVDIKTGKKIFFAKIQRKKAIIMHSSALTPNYYILIECPLEASLWDLIKVRLHYQLFPEALKWRPELDSKFHIIDRKTGKVTTIPTESFYYFHTINSYEENGKIIVDICKQDNVDFQRSAEIDVLLETGIDPTCNSYPARFEIDLEKKKITQSLYAGIVFEMPHFAEDTHWLKPYRYIYGMGLNPKTPNDVYNQIVKVDKLTGETKVWYEPEMYPEEPAFIKHPEAKTEDEGVLMFVVRDLLRSESALLFLDAQSFSELGRAIIPHIIPSGFHGKFFPSETIQNFEKHTLGMFRKEGFELNEVSSNFLT